MPDAVFGLEYKTPAGSRFRFFAVEADRATEPTTASTWNRKSFARTVVHYEAYVAGDGYRRHLKLTAPLLVLTVCSEPTRTVRMTDYLARRHPAGNGYMLFCTWEDFGPVFRPPRPAARLLDAAWQRAALPGFRIDRP